MTTRTAAHLLFAACATSACAPDDLLPDGQVIVIVTTDAPLPEAPGAPPGGPMDPPPLFDTLRIQVLSPSGALACAEGCQRDAALDRDMVEQGRASFGVDLPRDRAGYTVRLRLFRQAMLRESEPRLDGSIDATFALPRVRDEGIVQVWAMLATDTVGQQLGVPDPLVLETGSPPAGIVGTWPGARRVPCEGEPAEGEVCVPGGAFWMGDPRALSPSTPVDEQRLVILSPFFLGASETTVGAHTAWMSTLPPPVGALYEPWPRTETEGELYLDWCTFSETSDPELPVNCVTWQQARAACLSRGGDLPTAAQLEYVGRGLRAGRYPWGDEPPTCEDVVYGRAGIAAVGIYDGGCRPPGTLGGPVAVGSGLRDRVDLPDGAVLVDVAGNLAERSRDRAATQYEACWPEGIVVDPECDPGGAFAKEPHTSTVGGWLVYAGALDVAFKDQTAPSGSPASGFRCARKAGAVGATDAVDALFWLGFPCDADDDCGTDGLCLRPSDDPPSLGGGPANGYCSRACTFDDECGAGNVCRVDACFLGCTVGEPELQVLVEPLDKMKCWGREDTACHPVGGATEGGWCRPVCGSDAQCDGRKCDPKKGVCADEPSEGLPNGVPCGSGCAGVCSMGMPGNSVCTSGCSAGGDTTSETECGGYDVGFCALRLTPELGGLGDYAGCTIRCDAHDDCAAPYLWCNSRPYLGDFVAADHTYCVLGPACSNVGEPCSAGSELICTPTKHGNRCLDPTIPLGTLSP